MTLRDLEEDLAARRPPKQAFGQRDMPSARPSAAKLRPSSAMTASTRPSSGGSTRPSTRPSSGIRLRPGSGVSSVGGVGGLVPRRSGPPFLLRPSSAPALGRTTQAANVAPACVEHAEGPGAGAAPGAADSDDEWGEALAARAAARVEWGEQMREGERRAWLARTGRGQMLDFSAEERAQLRRCFEQLATGSRLPVETEGFEELRIPPGKLEEALTAVGLAHTREARCITHFLADFAGREMCFEEFLDLVRRHHTTVELLCILLDPRTGGCDLQTVASACRRRLIIESAVDPGGAPGARARPPRPMPAAPPQEEEPAPAGMVPTMGGLGTAWRFNCYCGGIMPGEAAFAGAAVSPREVLREIVRPIATAASGAPNIQARICFQYSKIISQGQPSGKYVYTRDLNISTTTQ